MNKLFLLIPIIIAIAIIPNEVNATGSPTILVTMQNGWEFPIPHEIPIVSMDITNWHPDTQLKLTINQGEICELDGSNCNYNTYDETVRIYDWFGYADLILNISIADAFDYAIPNKANFYDAEAEFIKTVSNSSSIYFVVIP